MSILDVAGQRFGKLVAIKRTADKDKDGKCYMWECQCDCGKICSVSVAQLRKGGVRSCGCLRSESKVRDVTGKRCGFLTAVEYTGRIENHSAVWRFRCDCGNEIEARLRSVNREKQSCGCHTLRVKKKQAIEMQKKTILVDGTSINALRSNVLSKNNTSGYRGVSWNSSVRKYQAQITFKRKGYHLGYFSTAEEASAAYQTARQRMHKEFLVEWEQRKKD